MIKMYKHADEFSSFYFIENPTITHNLLKDHYIGKNWIVDEFNLTGIRWDKDQDRDWYNDCLVGWGLRLFIIVLL